MKSENIIQTKSFAFAIRVVNLYKFLINEKKKFVLSQQLLKSDTPIGANVKESLGGQSEKDFLSKLSIAYKEARESVYWIKLLQAIDYITLEQINSLLQDAEEICKIIGKIKITLNIKMQL